MTLMHFIVSLFGTTRFDGVSVSIYVFDELQSNNIMHLLSEKSTHRRALFLMPTIDCPKNSTTPTYMLRCYSRRGEVDVPPLTGFAAAHVLINEIKVKAEAVIVFEGSRRLEFPVTKGGQIQCQIPLAPSIKQGIQGLQRLTLMDLFGIVKRNLDLEYIESCRTLVVYDSDADKHDLRSLAPKATLFTEQTTDQLGISTVIVCVKDKKTGGIFARAFLPAFGYAEAEMPAFATPYLGNQWAHKLGYNLFEISWSSFGKSCHILKKMEHPHSSFFARTATIQATSMPN
ncbi:hypothetical protein GGI12_003582 [Dipsacomyces acuminosporus]|nr:hypothetical protein GGI12_003582 [Dipsacomyces acuminosporus]